MNNWLTKQNAIYNIGDYVKIKDKYLEELDYPIDFVNIWEIIDVDLSFADATPRVEARNVVTMEIRTFTVFEIEKI